MITYDEKIHGKPLQTIQRCFSEICAGEDDPWIPLGKFMHQFFGQYRHRKEELLRDPIIVPGTLSPEQFRWAVFCAASAEYLSKKYELPCPEWATDPRYTLEERWYTGIGASRAQVQEKLRLTTPEEFGKRNIFCGNRTFRNKYEYQGRKTAELVGK
jgi:hypothetical protein